MKKILIATGALLTLAASQAWAMGPGYYPGYGPQRGHAIYGGYYAPAPQQAETPEALVREGLGKLRAFLRSNDARDKLKLMAFLESEITPYFDFAYMTRWAAGRAWRNMTDAQRTQLESKIKEMFFSTLARGLGGYDGNTRVDIIGTRRSRHDNEVRVGVRITRPGGYPVKIEFRFYRSRDGWKIFDAIANQSSAVTFYRRHFQQQLYAYGRR